MEALVTVRSLRLPDWAIGAGYIRSAVWDDLTDRVIATPSDDIDVLYFNAEDRDARHDEEIEAKLKKLRPGLPWSVRNQARMHIRNGDRPYHSTADALDFWLETPTCVAVRLDEHGNMHIIAPHGLQDLFSMRIRPTPRGRERPEAYRSRLEAKKWHEKWPNVVVDLP